MYACASRPTGVCCWTACRSMSPVERWRRPWAAASALAWVPFPAPGGPKRMSRIRRETRVREPRPLRPGKQDNRTANAGRRTSSEGRRTFSPFDVPRSTFPVRRSPFDVRRSLRPDRPERLRVDGVRRGDGLDAVDLADDERAVEGVGHPGHADEDAEAEEGAREDGQPPPRPPPPRQHREPQQAQHRDRREGQREEPLRVGQRDEERGAGDGGQQEDEGAGERGALGRPLHPARPRLHGEDGGGHQEHEELEDDELEHARDGAYGGSAGAAGRRVTGVYGACSSFTSSTALNSSSSPVNRLARRSSPVFTPKPSAVLSATSNVSARVERASGTGGA